eukprot:1143341-Pelagomonas_calceolata.AAC.5
MKRWCWTSRRYPGSCFFKRAHQSCAGVPSANSGYLRFGRMLHFTAYFLESLLPAHFHISTFCKEQLPQCNAATGRNFVHARARPQSSFTHTGNTQEKQHTACACLSQASCVQFWDRRRSQTQRPKRAFICPVEDRIGDCHLSWKKKARLLNGTENRRCMLEGWGDLSMRENMYLNITPHARSCSGVSSIINAESLPRGSFSTYVLSLSSPSMLVAAVCS